MGSFGTMFAFMCHFVNTDAKWQQDDHNLNIRDYVGRLTSRLHQR